MLELSPRTSMRRRLVILSMTILAAAIASPGRAAAFVSVTIAPPALPVYTQPPIPGPGYLWTPGYWAWSGSGYYWVPGTWVLPPAPGLLWTPGYWGWRSGLYAWNPGYWGPRVGFYGGINYGFGYVGTGFVGGYWRSGTYYYNTAVNNVNVNVVHNTYKTVVNNTTVNRTSFNGGSSGVRAEPTATEREVMNERHTESTAAQLQHEQTASGHRALYASANRGHPGIAATPEPSALTHANVTAARGSPDARRVRAEGSRAGEHPQGAGTPQPQANLQPAPHPRANAEKPQHMHAEGGGHANAGHPGGEANAEHAHR